MAHRFLPLLAALLLNAPAPTPPAAAPGAHDTTRPWVMEQAARAMSAASVGPLAPRGAVVRQAQAATSRPTAATALRREVFGFVNAGALTDPTVGPASWDFSLLSTVAYFGLHASPSGALVQNDTGWNVWHSSAASGLLNQAHASGVRVVLTVIYQEFPSGPNMCAALDNAATTAAQLQGQLLGADGVNIDYEGTNVTCPDGVAARSKVTAFARRLRAAGLGYLSIDTYASSAGDGGGFFDVPALAGTLDSLFVMDYDLETSNGPCGACLSPTSPLGGAPTYAWNVARSAQEYTPWAGQTILGFPYYGIKGCVNGPNPGPNAPVLPHTFGADPYASIVTYPSDPNISSWSEQRDALDPGGQEPWAGFYSGYASCWREEYWDDAVSLGHKYDLVNQASFRGAGMCCATSASVSPIRLTNWLSNLG